MEHCVIYSERTFSRELWHIILWNKADVQDAYAASFGVLGYLLNRWTITFMDNLKLALWEQSL